MSGLVASAFLFVQTAPVEARPAICGKLERQLASAGKSSGGNSKFVKASAAQARQLQIARGQARSFGCGGGLFGGNNNTGACSRIKSTIRKMEANLSSLNSKARGGIPSSTSRSRILAALDANDCNRRDGLVKAVSVEKKRVEKRVQEDGLLTILFGGRKVERRIPVAIEDNSRRIIKERPSIQTVKVTNGREGSQNVSVATGNYRTVCVRTCDGYYFPVSYNSAQSKFGLDTKLCEQMCPGTEVALYVHRVPDEESEDMVSLSGRPYAELATAFKYREVGLGVTPGCSCRAQMQETAFVDEQAEDTPKSKRSKWVPLPTAKPVAMLDEETRMNTVGGLDAAAIRFLTDPKTATAQVAANSNVRVVGPAFLPDQAQAEAVQVPDLTTVR